jgi:uracil-DNA glycosylase family 4
MAVRHDASTPEAHNFPALTAARMGSLEKLDAAVAGCRACPRLVAWREEVARVKRKRFQDWEYWGRPVPGFGPADARLAIIGLAPAAHGGNRTGRIFTGDPAGDALYRALYEVGLASQPIATHRGDGTRLYGVRITVPVHCAPPDNRPTTGERDTCRPWLARELNLLRPSLRAVVVLGAFGWHALLPVLTEARWQLPRPHPDFGHGAEALATASGEPPVHLIGSYHPSQRNMNTRTLTPAMLREVLRRGADLAGLATKPDRGSPDP